MGGVRSLISIILLSSNVLSGCSTLSNREKNLCEMAAAGMVGGLIGSASTPVGESSGAHALLWAGVATSAAAVVGLYANSDERELRDRERQIYELKREVGAFKGEDDSLNVGREIGRSSTTLEASLPPGYKHLVRPGSWTLFKRDEWIQVSETEMVHQDKRLVLSPPSLNFGQKGNEP